MLYSERDGALFLLCGPCNAVFEVDLASGAVVASGRLPASSSPDWRPTALGLLDSEGILAVAGTASAAGDAKLLYLCPGGDMVRTLGQLEEAAAAASVELRASLQMYDVDGIRTWPLELMDAELTCCYFGDVCAPGNCDALRDAGWTVPPAQAAQPAAPTKRWPAEWMNEDKTCCVLGDLCTSFHCHFLMTTGWDIPECAHALPHRPPPFPLLLRHRATSFSCRWDV